MQHLSIMAFDFGLKRIGVALAYSETQTCHPLKTVSGKNNQIKLLEISKLIKQWQPNLIVIGIPQHYSNSLNEDELNCSNEENVDESREDPRKLTQHELVSDILRFAKRIRSTCSLPIYFIDESFSSLEASEKLKENFIFGQDEKEFLDQVAAQGIAQSALMSRNGILYIENMDEKSLYKTPSTEFKF